MSKSYNKYNNRPNKEAKSTEKVEKAVEEIKDIIEDLKETPEEVFKTDDKEIKIEENIAIVNTPRLNFRVEPSKDSKILTILNQNDQVIVKAYDKIWSKVTFKNGNECIDGFVMSEFIDIKK